MDSIRKFDEQEFVRKLSHLKDTHDSITELTAWCLLNKDHHERVVAVWLSVLKRVSSNRKLLMFYLANDIIQYSKRRSLPYADSFAPALKKATTMVRDETIRNKIHRLFEIWDVRNIYEESFLRDLSHLLIRGHKNVSQADIEEFQPSELISRLHSCKALETDTDAKMNTLVESKLQLTDLEKMKESLHDRKASEEVSNDINDGVNKIKQYILALEAEIKERSGLVDLLEVGRHYYEKEMGEAKMVVNAYTCFTSRVKLVKRKLVETTGALSLPSNDLAAKAADLETKTESNVIEDSFPPKSYTSPLYFTRFSAGNVPLPLSSPLSLVLPPPPPPPSLPSECPPPYNPLHTLYPSLAPSTVPSNNIDFLMLPPPPPPEPPVPPPPAPPKYLQTGSVPVDNIWSEPTEDRESPESPPNYEKEGYLDPFDDLSAREDVDMRCKDVDHRNLMSLSGNSDTDIRVAPWSSEVEITTDVEKVDMEKSDNAVGRSKYHKIKSLGEDFFPNDRDSRVWPLREEFVSVPETSYSFNDFSPNFAPLPQPSESVPNNGFWRPSGHHPLASSKAPLFQGPPPTYDLPPITGDQFQFDASIPLPPLPTFFHSFTNMSQGSYPNFRSPGGSQSRFPHPKL